MLKEFKAFALRGNVMDLAVGVIIGAAFGTIVNSVVNDLIMPLVGIFFKADFKNLYLPLSDAVKAKMAAVPNLSLDEAKKEGPVFAYGNFITIVINFVILAFIIFLMVKGMNSLKKKEEAAPAPTPETPQDIKLLTEIRDLLKK
ncbi:large conductance mechanosensitive channel protein MscL [Pseudochryseolinea flava]|uniref:Large-conductance mechanosensitive channel n=1 Tax=Pseudochryseolinea flava TaxID=2059302 RepID=A0A364Y5N6_9BACT|nr:large conductance mechanosensitive channel protein MscL [Pseudochryseolinea flava]RAW01371.1 large conductance mechanosensitive channel protein MscL [Pseudochryseolinea flava]